MRSPVSTSHAHKGAMDEPGRQTQAPAATKVLLVEDNPQNLKYAGLVLGKGGYTVLTATNGEAALAVARAQQPRVVVMDVQMPVMDGLTATRLLKQDTTTAGIKVLALTALAMKGDEERILAAGCDAYLTKPFGYQELLDAVEALLA